MSSTTKAILTECAKVLLVAALIVFLVTQLGGARESSTTFEVMSNTVTAAADLSPMQLGDNQMIKRLYGLDPSAYEGCLLYYPTTNMGAEELLLIKLKDTSQQDNVKAAVEARMAAQQSSFDGYAIPQYEMCCSYDLELQGNYILLIVAEDPSVVRQAFLGAL